MKWPQRRAGAPLLALRGAPYWMLAVWMLPAIHYDPLRFFTSVLIGLFASSAAPWIAPKAPADNHAKA